MAAKKYFWFKFEWRVWREDKALRRCSLETRGFWLECLCIMYEEEEVFIEGTIAQIANLIGCSEKLALKAIEELKETNAALIEFGTRKNSARKSAKIAKSQDFVKVVSRRLLKAVNLKEYNRLKKREERERKNVKTKSNSPFKDQSFKVLEDSSYEESKDNASVPPAREIFLGTVLAGIQTRLDLKSLSSKVDWQRSGEWAHENGFTSDQYLECYDLLRQQRWRDGPIKPKTVTENLTNLEKLRKEIAKQNAETQSSGPESDGRTSQEVAESVGASDVKFL